MNNKIMIIGTIAMDTILSVNELPIEDGFSHIDSEHTTAGGSSANVGVALNGMGVKVYQSGKIGDDEFGKKIQEDLKTQGISDKYLVVKNGGVTLHTYIAVDPNGAHCILANSGDCVMNMEPEELPKDIIDNIDIFYTDLASPRASIALAKECKKHDIPVIVNLQNKPSDEDNEKINQFKEVLQYTTLFITGKTTICSTMNNENETEAIHQFLDGILLPDGYICTLGAEGANWYINDEVINCGIVPVETIDTTGAGDAYIAGIIYAYYIQNRSREKSMQYAAATAALKCTQNGPRLKFDCQKISELEKVCNMLYREGK